MKIKKYKAFNELRVSVKSHKCPVCHGQLYRTDAGGNSVTLQCSSDEARFWNFPRGSDEQKTAHNHFMKSTTTISNEEWNKLEKV